MEKKTTQLTGILIVSMLMCASLVAVITLSPLDKGTYTYKLNTFQSYDDLLAFLHKRFETGANQGRYYDSPNLMFAKSESAATAMEQLKVVRCLLLIQPQMCRLLAWTSLISLKPMEPTCTLSQITRSLSSRHTRS